MFPVVLAVKVPVPKPTLFDPVVLFSKLEEPTAVLVAPEVFVVSAFLPIAVLLFPVTAASKAPVPRTVLLETEFVPLPTVIPLIVWSAVNVLAVVILAKLPSDVTPACQAEPLYTLSSSSPVLKYKSPSASELPPPSVDGLEDATWYLSPKLLIEVKLLAAVFTLAI